MIFKCKRFLFLTLLSLLLLTSCAQYKYIGIQTLKPSELTIPKDFVRPIISAGIYRGVAGSDESMAQAALDSTAALEAASVLVESLADSPWFQGIEIPVKSHYRDESSRLILPYPWSKVEQMVATEEADLLISLEYIKITPEVDDYSYWDGATNAYYGALTMKLYAYWRIYDIVNQKVYAEHLQRDTMVWEETDYFRVKVGDQLPGFFHAALYCGYSAGAEYAKRIAPTWMDEQRLIFTRGAKEMQTAHNHALRYQWVDASALWQKVIANPKVPKKTAARAAFNLAVANEMLGQFDIAIEWLAKATELFPLPETPIYRRIIEHRVKLLEKL